MSSLDPTAVRALVEARHSTPFDVLGVHATHPGGGPGRVVRALLPWARTVQVLRDGRSWPMQRTHAAGLFEAEWPDEESWFDYRLEATPYEGEPVVLEDPYRLPPLLDEGRLHGFNGAAEIRAWEILGAWRVEHGGRDGFAFALWAPNADAVSVIGDFNGWDARIHPMRPRGTTGVWELFVPGLRAGQTYKYSILTKQGSRREKADPYARGMERRPRSASVLVDDVHFDWTDQDWLRRRREANWESQAVTIYEVHLGSWRRNPPPEGESQWAWLSYRELADRMLPYVADLGFTHVELMPITEHPFDGSWGYQTLGYFAPTSRFGSPDDFRYFVDRAHALGLGVILDWVPAHFPTDDHGLAWFDGTHLYEHEDPRKGSHPDWGTLIYNYARNEVQSFLLSSALFWIEMFHVDGLRVDAVASMLYLDYSREEGGWIPNEHGGRENYEAIAFLRRLNGMLHTEHPGVLSCAEESTAWTGVSRPLDEGGLGFDLKWNMGWMNDTLDYIEHDPVYRKHMHDRLTFSLVYAFSERFLLPLSHDEVVHGKQALLAKMPGYDPDRFATLRLLYTYMWTHPGKKLLFMGGELGQWSEWNHETSLEWHLLEYDSHRGIHDLVRRLNQVVREEVALHEVDHRPEGFEWIDVADADRSMLMYLRWSADWRECVLVVGNFTPVSRPHTVVGVPFAGRWELLLDSAAPPWGGSHAAPGESFDTKAEESHGRPHRLELDVPPLGALVLRARRERGDG